MSQRVASSRRAILKEVFWRPAAGLVAALSALFTLFSLFRYTVFASVSFNQKTVGWVLSWHWHTWLAFWSVVWIFVILKGALAAVRRREAIIASGDRHRMALEENARGISNALDSERTRTTQLEAELSEARRSRDRLEAENQELKAQQEKAVRLSLSLKTEERLRPILTRPTQDSFGAPNYVHVSEMTLLIYNHGERPVAPRGCKIWKLHATEATQELPIHGVVTSAAPMPVDITVPLLHAISGNKPIDFASLQGKCSLRIVVAYSEGSVHKDAEPRDFELSCKPWRGGMTLRIEAIEVTSEQS